MEKFQRNDHLTSQESNKSITAVYLLTEIQNGILFEIFRNEYSDPVYIVQMIFSIQIDLNISLILKAFDILVQRHEILRSAIKYDEHSYSQIVYSEINIPHASYDYSKFSLEDKQKEFDTFLKSDLKKSMNLYETPLMRLAFFKFGDNDYRLVWTRHHILMDGTSAELLIKELITIYQTILKNKTWILPQPSSYKKICDINQYVDSPEVENYWKQSLKKYSFSAFLPPLLESSEKIKKIDHQIIFIEGKDYKDLVEFSQEKSLTINSIVQSAWGIVLSHYNDKRDVIFGTVRAYPKDKVENCVGLFINTLPIYLDVDPSLTIIEYIQSNYKKNKLLRKYVNTPLSKIRTWCDLSVDAPLYQCIIDYKAHSLKQMIEDDFPEFKCSISFKLNIPYPMVLEIVNDSHSLKINLHYEANIFEGTYIDSILQYYKKILKGIMKSSEMTLAELPTLLEADLEKIISWNKTKTNYSLNKTIHQLFEEQVKKTPHSPALVFEDTVLTYQMLNQQANQLAYYLIENSVTLETPVAICLKPNLNMMIAVLAVLKAGAAYIPIDPNYPHERIKYLLQDSQPKIVITEQEQFNFLSQCVTEKNFGTSLINIQEFAWHHYPDKNPSLSVMLSNLMYIIYTSGSTGNPKGVMVEHRSAVNTAFSCIDWLKVTPESRILQVSSFSFDVSIAEWSMALLSGASLYLINKDIFSPRAIVDSLKTHKITTIILASSILDVLPKEELIDLKVIAPGGEACTESTIEFWRIGRRFLNIYGITETTICSTMANYDSKQVKPTIIGKPLPNTTVFILNSNLRPAALGVPGEIYIGGAGVARGYLNNHELTEQKFISTPQILNEQNNITKIYKTGDLGRWLPSGEIEYLGRIDDQLKIRGFRVEPSEIERTLEKHPQIKQASVITKFFSSNKQLVAYVVGTTTSLDLNNVREFLRTLLPSYMVPSKLIVLNELPLTPNGKVNKKKLATLEITQDQPQIENLKQISVIEDTILEIIQSILNEKNIAKDQNFLDLGFDSLSLVLLSSELSRRFEVEIDIVNLFTYTTIEALSNYIGDHIKHNNKKLNPIEIQY